MSKYDKDIKVGDIITAYHKGFHRVTRIERRFNDGSFSGNRGDEYSSLIYYQTVLSSKYTFPPKGLKEKKCDAAYCEVVTPNRIEQEKKELIENITAGYDALLKIVSEKKCS